MQTRQIRRLVEFLVTAGNTGIGHGCAAIAIAAQSTLEIARAIHHLCTWNDLARGCGTALDGLSLVVFQTYRVCAAWSCSRISLACVERL